MSSVINNNENICYVRIYVGRKLLYFYWNWNWGCGNGFTHNFLNTEHFPNTWADRMEKRMFFFVFMSIMEGQLSVLSLLISILTYIYLSNFLLFLFCRISKWFSWRTVRTPEFQTDLRHIHHADQFYSWLCCLCILAASKYYTSGALD